ncbi:DNA-binding transcriptional regulator, AcrR family [Amycolatopsis pretoriensis]|uniref:DNA-binding transcriptional regulator, AcrR family n=1 Tax=Amycolatopsis pretoriensis TaxID=218821 RepID=A0A1H5QC59_9PSEU|nr:TetR/AcrR family transcriptional regulator [Amycolatopsis pretoriensis]SEF23589.1 DNA-binding transcriptional regulator, AcrR family [Amycolatopsis pretoriensis]
MNVKAARASATRESILVTAERLFAEHGVQVVSNRHISEAAGQGNNAAVNYHFGTKVDLVRAIVRRHAERMERLRAELVEAIDGDGDLRDWVACLVLPSTTYLRELGAPTWFARFSAQVMTDPALREIIAEESLSSPALARAVEGLNRCLDGLPADVRAERGDMARQLMIHMVAERERALSEGTPTPRATWDDAGTGLIDAITGLLLAPVTPVRPGD